MKARFIRDGSKRLVKLAGPASFMVLSLGMVSCNGNDSSSGADAQSDQEAVHTAAQAVCSQSGDSTEFPIVRSAAAANAGCLANAHGHVRIQSLGPVEEMTVRVHGLPAHTDFDFFVIQVPNAPFGMAWYQGDIETDEHGRGEQRFVGRFSIETFIVAPGVAPAPVVHPDGQFPDASENKQTAPVHMFHLGLWFNSPNDAAAAGCPDTVTPFNGDHTAGIQVLSSRNFQDLEGPLSRVE